ncbi:hypothetical protein [Caballeronia ptereochthonis]|uniref:Preprotein translocase subunit SecA n=1 Tax=Caballeronia ptereochthonis TaxID=1777144 RepID=A0A158DRM1_9BURK|nr:hypothetical protein [Caballeronia ptereochthonis]SAK97244.1 hypothetical protein AWB83_05796 [Caballeronia ptereochthonis]
MLSPHEISTLLLVQRSPHQVEVFGQHAARLRQEALVEIARLPSGVPMPLLTPKGQDMLKRLDALWKLRSNGIDESDESDESE